MKELKIRTGDKITIIAKRTEAYYKRFHIKNNPIYTTLDLKDHVEVHDHLKCRNKLKTEIEMCLNGISVGEFTTYLCKNNKIQTDDDYNRELEIGIGRFGLCGCPDDVDKIKNEDKVVAKVWNFNLKRDFTINNDSFKDLLDLKESMKVENHHGCKNKVGTTVKIYLNDVFNCAFTTLLCKYNEVQPDDFYHQKFKIGVGHFGLCKCPDDADESDHDSNDNKIKDDDSNNNILLKLIKNNTIKSIKVISKDKTEMYIELK